MDSKNSDTLRGNLFKWTNYIKGYRKRWFVLQNGFVSYYKNQAEMAHTCRGTINLLNATVESTGPTSFTISNSSNQTFHLRAANEADQKTWVSSLLSARSKAMSLRRSAEDSDASIDGDDCDEYKNCSISPDEAVRIVNQALAKLETHLSDLQLHHETLTRRCSELQRAIADMESARDASELLDQFSVARERMTVYKVVSLAMVSSCTEFVDFSRGQVQRWRRVFNSQHERCGLLEQLTEQLAKQLRQLEMMVKHNNPQATHTLAGANATRSSGQLEAAHGPSAFPGQAVRVDQDQTQKKPATMSQSPTHNVPSPTPTKTDIPIKEATQKPVPRTETSPAGAHTEPSFDDSSDDDFYDAEEVSTEFSVFLPPTNRNETYGTGNSTDVRPKDDDTSSTVLGPPDDDSSLPVDSDMAFEYESDIDSPEDDTFRKRTSSKGLREAQVIQTRRRQTDSRTGTLVSSGDRPSDQAEEDYPTNASAVVPKMHRTFERRTSIPPRPNYSLNLWSIMKNCIGKELTKIPMPVNFSEPLSMLQRLTEDFEYADCLDRAARCTDSLEQMVHVAAFTVSSYATTAVRVNKPFNPLLWETYECDRTDDLGWRSLAEQVSHHPPKCALHCESNAWYCWFEFSMNTKFRGKYLQILPIGTCHLVFRRTGHHYTWKKIPMTVHNIIVGRLWIDNSGEMDIVNHHTGEKCHLSYKAYSFFSNEARRVTGAVTDKSGSVRYVLDGAWDEYMEYSPVVHVRTNRGGKPVLETGPATLLWRCNPLPPDADRMYSFTSLALQLNEEEPGVCPTDSRFRPDQRLMERGEWDEANREKVVLEEKQRTRRRQAAMQLASQSIDTVDNSHKPLWFDRTIDSDTGTSTFVFNGNYWKCKARGDWSMCPNIY